VIGLFCFQGKFFLGSEMIRDLKER